MNSTVIFFTKLFCTAILGLIFGWLTLFPMAHSDTLTVLILPVLGGLVQNLTKGLNQDAPNKSGASNAGDAPSSQLPSSGETK